VSGQTTENVFTAKYPTLGKYTFYRALGTGEQGLWVIPEADLVVVHRADTDHGRRVEGADHWALVESILAARRTEPKPKPDLRPLQPTVLSSQLPRVTVPGYRSGPESVLATISVITTSALVRRTLANTS
jgi:hypothetical protein